MTTTPPSQPLPQPAPGGPVGKLDTSNAFERIFQVYGSQFLVLLGLALAIFIPLALLQGIIAQTGSLGLLFLLIPLGIAGQALYTGAVVEAVADMRDGKRDFSIGQLLGSAVPFIVPLILGGLLLGIVLILGLFLLIVGFFVFLTWFCLVTPAIVVERQGVFGAFQRSKDLVRGNGWRVFGVLVVTFVILAVVSTVIQQIALGINDGFAGAFIGNVVGSLITAPIGAIAVSTLYFMLRDLREGPPSYPAPHQPQPQPGY